MLLPSNAFEVTPEERRRAVRLLLVLIAIPLLAAASWAVWGQPPSRWDVSQPMLLVASDRLQGPYRGTVMFVVASGDKHLGFILNRPTGKKMGEIFPEHAPSKAVTDPVYFGGPEAADAIFAMTATYPGAPAVKLTDGVYLTGFGKLVDQIIETTPNEARYYAGFVGWMPGELRDELRRGLFTVRQVMPGILFLPDTSTLHERLRVKGPEA